MFTITILIISFMTICECLQCNTSYQCELYSELEKRQSCSTMARPIQDFGAPTEVDLFLMLMSTNELDERRQIFQATVWIAVHWKDFNMRWNAEHFGGINSAILPVTKLWTPDLCFMNDVTNDKCIKVKDEEKVSMNSSGYVTWWISKDVRTQCDVNIERFPFDEQNCSIDIGTWYSSDEFVRLRSKYPKVYLGNYKPGGEWVAVDSWITYQTINNFNFTKILFWIRIKRQPLFNLYYVLLPVVLLSVLQVVCFVLPIESGEKVGLAVAIFLSFSLFISMINNNTPRQSNHKFRLGMYITTELVMSGLTIVMQVFVLRLYHRKAKQAPGVFYRLLLSKEKCCWKNKAVETSYDLECGGHTPSSNHEDQCDKRDDIPEDVWHSVAARIDGLFGFMVMAVNVCSLAAYFISVFA